MTPRERAEVIVGEYRSRGGEPGVSFDWLADRIVAAIVADRASDARVLAEREAILQFLRVRAVYGAKSVPNWAATALARFLEKFESDAAIRSRPERGEGT